MLSQPSASHDSTTLTTTKPPQSDIPDDLKADSELPLDPISALGTLRLILVLCREQPSVAGCEFRLETAIGIVDRIAEALKRR